jgi:hypothetical protein
MANEEFEGEFTELINNGLHGLVGASEIEAREILGNERYEKTVAWIETNNALILADGASKIKYTEAVSFLFTAIGFTFLTATIMGIAWSIYFWVK